MLHQQALQRFNRHAAGGRDAGGMLDCVAEDVEHRVNEGGVRRGRALFAEFCSHMGVSYREELKDLVIFANADGTRGAAEFVVHGEYLQTDPGLPEAKGQRYILPAGAFFDIEAGKITRVTTCRAAMIAARPPADAHSASS